LKSSTAARDAAKATILKAQADLLAKTEIKNQERLLSRSPVPR
jgi:hypothetical protein